MPTTDKGGRDEPKEARWRKVRLIASAIAALSSAAYHAGRFLIWLRNWL